VAQHDFLDLFERYSSLRFIEALIEVTLQLFVDVTLLGRVLDEGKLSVRQRDQRVGSTFSHLVGSNDRSERIDTLVALLRKVVIGELLKCSTLKFSYTILNLVDLRHLTPSTATGTHSESRTRQL